MNSVIPIDEPQPAECVPMVLLLVEGSIKAGFPYPAQDFDCRPVDLSSVLVRHPQATFMIRASGVSMLGAGINNGDILLVDRAITPQHGQIVCAIVDNYFTVKYLHRKYGKFRLVAADPTIPDIIPGEAQQIEVWGVVTVSITRHLKL